MLGSDLWVVPLLGYSSLYVELLLRKASGFSVRFVCVVEQKVGLRKRNCGGKLGRVP